MEFYTASTHKRPIRLSEDTRSYAYESMQGKYGEEAMKHPCVCMDHVEGFGEMKPQEKYNAMILKIAGEAPLRICEQESVSGAATLGNAIYHIIPATYQGKTVQGSVSHLTVDFPTVLFQGVDYLEEKLDRRLEEETDPQKIECLAGMKNVVKALHIYHDRYLAALQDKKPENYENLKRVPFAPATNFKEAVQSLWFTFSFIRLCGNWPGIGRIDEMLGGFLEQDLENGAITIEEAREYLAGMFIKGCEWIQRDTPCGAGDAQHYQNILLAGIDREGREVTNAVTYLVLDIVEELGISDFPITVRINENTPEKLLTRVAEVMRHGGGVIAVYNEPLILQSLENFGYDRKEAREFANDGCWEVQIPGKTYFSYNPIDALQILQKDTLRIHTDTPAEYDTFENLYKTFYGQLNQAVEINYMNNVKAFTGKLPGNDWEWVVHEPDSVVSLFEEGCIESGRGYASGGPKYTVKSPHIGGAPDVGNSLYAIDKLVFQEKKISFADFMQVLKNNWEGHEVLRQYVSNKYVYYGNDNDEADAYTVRVLNDFADMVERTDRRVPIRFPAGVSTFGRQIDWLPRRMAVPFGRKKGEILAGNTSPTPGTDFEGATAQIRSYCKIDLVRQTCGAALDVKLYPASVAGENGIEALKGLMRGFLTHGGFFMQLDVVDAQVLLEAQKHPEQYKTLSVRVSGWNARFVTLNDKWQQMIIERTTQNV